MASQMNIERKRDVELPDDMLFEILALLPAKLVCISKCCSKSFLNLTNSTIFALKQSQNSLLKDHSYFFIQNSTMCAEINTEIHSSLPSSSSTSDQIPREVVGVPSKFLCYIEKNFIKILASSNGLLLCETLKRQLLICNPTTLSHSFISNPITNPITTGIFSFECNNKDEDYKLYALGVDYDYVQSTPCLVFKMYIPKEGVWKEKKARLILEKSNLIYYKVPVFYKGAIHFLIRDNNILDKYLVGSYNVESGVLRIIELPEVADRCYDGQNVGIFKWGEVGSKKESICCVKLERHWENGFAFTFTAWVLSDHESSSGVWSKIFCVSLKEMGFHRKCYRVPGFTIMNGRSLVFATESKVYKGEVYDYDLSGKRETRLEKVCDQKLDAAVHLFPYSDTLRSCGIGSTTLAV